MLDLLLKLLDYLRDLVKERTEVDARVFDRLVTPAFEVAEKVVQNYFQIFDGICAMAKDGATEEEIIRYLESGRTEFLPARIRLRTMVNPYRPAYFDQTIQNEHRFVAGLRGVLCGGLSTYEERQWAGDYARTGHTILDILYQLHRRRGHAPLPELVCDLANRQRAAVADAWQDMVTAYTNMQTEIARTGRLPPLVRREPREWK